MIIGAGPGGVWAALAALAALKLGYDVRLCERTADPKPIGGSVLLSVPVLAVLRHSLIDLDGFGSYTRTEFRTARGKVRVNLPFNPLVEQKTGLPGWHYGMLRSNAFARMLALLPEGGWSPAARWPATRRRSAASPPISRAVRASRGTS